jgi:hypothetical protein
MVCHRVLQDIGTEAARCLGGFGAEEKEQEARKARKARKASSRSQKTSMCLESPEEQHSIEDAPRTRRCRMVLLEVKHIF